MPVDASNPLEAAKAAQTGGYLDEASRLCRQAIAGEPDNVEAILMLAGLLQAQSDFDGAIGLANLAIRLQPGLFNGYSILGYCHLALGQFENAVNCLAKAISIEPNVPILHHLAANALQQLDREDEALKAYRRAVQLAPHVVESQIALGQLQLKLGNRAEAITCFRRAYKLEPNSARGLCQWAKALTELSRHGEAEVALRRAISRDPGSAAPQAMLGEVLLQLGRFDEASMVLESAISIQPDSARSYLHRVQCRRVSENDSPVLERMAAMLDEPGRSADELRYLHYALGKSFDDLNEYENAMLHFDAANRIMLQLARPQFRREAHAAQVKFAVENLTDGFLSTNSSVGSDSETPVFIVGMIRSGTTLVEQILSSHPAVGAGGELQFWLDNTRGVVDSSRIEIDPLRLPSMAGRYLEILCSLAPGKLRVTDKMPLNFMVLGVIHLAFPRARIIHCRRNPLDNCLSMYLTPFSQPVNYAHSRENIVYWYEDYLRLMEHWRAILPPDRFLDVDYEDLVMDPDRVTRQMIDFVGIEWNDACLRPEANRRTVRTPSMWQVRQPVYRTSIERWRNYEPWLGEFRKLLPSPAPLPDYQHR